MASFSIMYCGRELCRLQHYYTHQLLTNGVDRVVPKLFTRAAQDWAHNQLRAAGITVRTKPDAITKKRQMAAAQGAERSPTADTPGQPPAGVAHQDADAPSPSTHHRRRSRRTNQRETA